ncbi:Imm21 family immunity protein [Streptomyces sp. NPDC059819]|uniref:Imm21 family immunity protein n=1 Tax=Streptomyces sp. NPDC059819 TaxID=3346963 RepID=UPI00364A5EBB
MRWLAADSDAEILEAARAVLDDPATGWKDCGVWQTDGPAALRDSAVSVRVGPPELLIPSWPRPLRLLSPRSPIVIISIASPKIEQPSVWPWFR